MQTIASFSSKYAFRPFEFVWLAPPLFCLVSDWTLFLVRRKQIIEEKQRQEQEELWARYAVRVQQMQQ